ncbi:RnfABCDGE type electron transport complex subunit D [Blautia schinkii]|nr:RnfABCDGE type electron transport complex subunit D [Blautia schinkii]
MTEIADVTGSADILVRQAEKFPVAPYLRTKRSSRGIMGDVCIALVPALLGAAYFFGMRALGLAAASVAVCVLTEYVWQKLTKSPVTVGDLSAAVTGILLAMNLPVTTPYWVVISAGIFTILIAKQLLGGIGNNFVNPALLGRLFVMLVWPGRVMQYVLPGSAGTDAVTSATILGSIKSGGENPYSYWEMFVGAIPGSLGETSKLLLLVGFAYLCYKGAVNAGAALIYTGTVAAVTFVLGPQGLFTGDILENLLSGGLILGACYMLTDYMFVSRKGKILYAVTAGVLTSLFRIYSVYPEGVCFGILTANCLSGAMSSLYKRHVYGVDRTYKPL